MQNGMVVRGVPRSLVLDGWWLDTEVDVSEPRIVRTSVPTGDLINDKGKRRATLLFAVLVLADILLYRQEPGLSVALFAGILFGASILEHRSTKALFGPSVVLFFSVLPIIEYFQLVSFAICVAGLIASASWARIGGQQSVEMVLRASQKLLQLMPLEGLRTSILWSGRAASAIDLNGALTLFVRNWAIPLGGAVLIASLLITANPVLERWLENAFSFNHEVPFDWLGLLTRILFWGGLALISWPFLSIGAEKLTCPRNARQLVWAFPKMGLNANSVSNALMIFNCMLAFQLVLDGQFFWLGGALPEGMGYATYAHRGAYPLFVTALLAGGFALAARPFLNNGPWLKPLMTVWLGLNVLLTLSSMYRLALYVDIYGLTYLRLRAGIWMVLVVIWLCLIAWQILREQERAWLVWRSLILGGVTVYLCSFINFAHHIAAFNMEHDRKDLSYVCSLGELSRSGVDSFAFQFPCSTEPPEIEGWRDWGYRKWRVARYIKQTELMETTDETSRRR